MVRGYVQTPRTTQAIAVALICPLGLDAYSPNALAQDTLVTGQGEIKLALLRKLPSLLLAGAMQAAAG